MGTAVPLADRGYVNAGNRWRELGYYTRLFFNSADDCAMACDLDTNCKGFSFYNRVDQPSSKNCVLQRNRAATSGNPGSTPDWFSGGVVYDAPSNKQTLSNVAVTKWIPAVGGAWDLDRGGPLDQFGNREFCDSGATYGGPSVYEAAGSGSWAAGRRTCRQVYNGARSCTIPGVVTKVEQQGVTDTRCTYASLSNTWIKTNWTSLSNYFDAPEVARVKRYYCNSLTSTELVQSTECSQFLKAQGNDQDIAFAQSIIDSSTRAPTWYATADMVSFVNACKTNGTSAQCASKIPSIDATQTWTNQTIDGLNDITFSDKYDTNLAAAVKTKVDEYCPKGSSKQACACSNAVKLGILNCTAGTPGCETLTSYKETLKKLEADPKYASLRQTLLDTYTPRKQAPECKSASSVGSGVLLYDRSPVSDDITINACFQEVANYGTAGNLSQKCDITNIKREAAKDIKPAGDKWKPSTMQLGIAGGISLLCCCFVIMIILILRTPSS